VAPATAGVSAGRRRAVAIARSIGGGGPRREITPRGIDEARYVPIGGTDQYISIRGEDRDNPVILFLHGGPGDATNPWGYLAFRSWLKYFTVVHLTRTRTEIAGTEQAASSKFPAAGIRCSRNPANVIERCSNYPTPHEYRVAVQLRVQFSIFKPVTRAK
jgi:hypothetical protein